MMWFCNCLVLTTVEPFFLCVGGEGGGGGGGGGEGLAI